MNNKIILIVLALCAISFSKSMYAKGCQNHFAFTKQQFDDTSRPCLTLPFGLPSLVNNPNVVTSENKIRLQTLLDSFGQTLDSISWNDDLETLKLYLQKNENFKLKGYFNEQINLGSVKNYSVKLASIKICLKKYQLMLVSVSGLNRFRQLYLFVLLDNVIKDGMKVYMHKEANMGFTYYSFFYIDKLGIISVRDYSITEAPVLIRPTKRFTVNQNGNFVQYKKSKK
jgi:hypothetical protein